MATVRITEKLINITCYNADRLFDKRLAEAHKLPEFGFSLADRIIDDYASAKGWSEALRIMPPEWGQKVDKYYLNRCNDVVVGQWINLAAPRYLPAPLIGTINANAPMLEPVADVLRVWRSNITALNSDKQDFRRKVETYLLAHTTLKPAIEGWPALTELLDREYLDKHNEPTERRVREKPVHNIDVSQLTGQLVVAKIVNS